jgi:hypothetical protein
VPKTRPALTDEQRGERRRADREFAREAVERLRSSEGWQRWLAARRHFHAYSLANQLLIAMHRRDEGRRVPDVAGAGLLRANGRTRSAHLVSVPAVQEAAGGLAAGRQGPRRAPAHPLSPQARVRHVIS